MKKLRSASVKVIAILLILMTLVPSFPISAYAANSWPSVSTSFYCEFIASKNINVYRYSNCKTPGTSSPARSYNAYVETGDKCRIIEMSSSFFKIQYPTSSGYKTGFVKRWDVVSVDSPTKIVKSAGKATTYTKAYGSEYGHVAKNDQTYVCGESNGYVAVIYPAKSGSRAYKLGYVKSSDYNNIIAPSGTPTVTAKKTISNGTYYVCSALNTNMRLDCEGGSKDNGGNVLLWTGHNGDNQKLKVTYLDNGYYKLEFVHSNKCLDVAGVSYKSGANVHQWTYGGGNNQQWIIADAGSGYYYIVARHSGKFLDVAGGKSTDGTNVQVYDGNRTNAQKFKFVSASTNNSTNNTTSTKLMSNILYGVSGTKSYITCGFDGYSSTSGRHEGIDFKRGNGYAVYSLTSGEITRVTQGSQGRYGLSTIAIYDSSTNKTVVYLHTDPLDSLYVGQRISVGQQIAVEDWRGCSTSAKGHTHVEVRNGKKTSAAKSVDDYTLDNPNPTSFWQSKGYTVK